MKVQMRVIVFTGFLTVLLVVGFSFLSQAHAEVADRPEYYRAQKIKADEKTVQEIRELEMELLEPLRFQAALSRLSELSKDHFLKDQAGPSLLAFDVLFEFTDRLDQGPDKIESAFKAMSAMVTTVKPHSFERRMKVLRVAIELIGLRDTTAPTLEVAYGLLSRYFRLLNKSNGINSAESDLWKSDFFSPENNIVFHTRLFLGFRAANNDRNAQGLVHEMDHYGYFTKAQHHFIARLLPPPGVLASPLDLSEVKSSLSAAELPTEKIEISERLVFLKQISEALLDHKTDSKLLQEILFLLKDYFTIIVQQPESVEHRAFSGEGDREHVAIAQKVIEGLFFRAIQEGRRDPVVQLILHEVTRAGFIHLRLSCKSLISK